MKAIIYCRVSSEEQAREGVSLDAQLGKGRKWADLNDAEVVAEYQDAGIRGKKRSNRPGVQLAIHDACYLKATLVVYSLSRLARNTRETLEIAEELSAAGANLVSVTEKIDTTGACGKMVFRLMAVLAEFESDLISERTKMALQHLKAQGKRIGQVPYGFNLGKRGQLLENRKQQQVIVMMEEMRGLGNGYSAIAADLNGQGIKSKTGGLWHPKVVRDILLRPCQTNAQSCSMP